MKLGVRKRIIVPAIGLTMLCACKKDPVDQYFEDTSVYFDIGTFFRTQVDNLNKRKLAIRQRVVKDGFAQTIEKEQVNWEEELAPFIDADINRPAWRGQFKVDTVLRNDHLVVIEYTLRDADKNDDGSPVEGAVKGWFRGDPCPISKVVLTKDPRSNTPLKVSIDKLTNNFLYSSSHKLYFTTGEGYMVKGRLEVKYLFSSEYSVDSKFVEI